MATHASFGRAGGMCSPCSSRRRPGWPPRLAVEVEGTFLRPGEEVISSGWKLLAET
jgi:hypothetical protein